MSDPFDSQYDLTCITKEETLKALRDTLGYEMPNDEDYDWRAILTNFCRINVLDEMETTFSKPKYSHLKQPERLLCLLSSCNHPHVIDSLKIYMKSPKLNLKNASYYPLHSAIKYGRLDIIKLLFTIPELSVSHTQFNPLVEASKHNKTHILKYLIDEQGMDHKINDYAPIITATTKGKIKAFEYLWSLGGYPEPIIAKCSNIASKLHNNSLYIYIANNCSSNTVALFYNAIENDNMQLLQVLSTDHSNTLQLFARSLFTRACYLGNVSIMKHIQDSTKMPLVNSDVLLLASVLSGSLESIKFFTSQGIMLSEEHVDLIAASIAKGNIDVTKYLVEEYKEYGSKCLKMTDVNSETIMSAIVKSGNVEMAKYVVNIPGVRTNSKLLNKAVKCGSLDMVKFVATLPDMSMPVGGLKPICIACGLQDRTILVYLLSLPNISIPTELIIKFVDMNDFKTLKLLLQHSDKHKKNKTDDIDYDACMERIKPLIKYIDMI